MMTKKPITILFDDYVERTNYHVVENLFSDYKTVGRMAIFDVLPSRIDGSMLLDIIPLFFTSS